jgi:hypothetical protein
VKGERLFEPDTVVRIENRMCWEREILVLKENCEEEFELSQFK